MKKFGKAILIMTLTLMFAGLAFSACEKATEIRAASITEITAAGSDNFGVRISFMEDKRIENKSVDIQIMADKAISNVVIWHENQDKQSIAFAEKDKWYSLTTLLVKAQNKPNTEQFEKFGEALTKTYLFNSEEKIKLKFRVVVGDAQPNVQESGQVLTGTFEISEEFTLKIN